MKSKKTIRRLKSPLARDLAKLSRELHSMRRRVDTLTEKAEDQALELRLAHREISELHTGKMMPQSLALESALQAVTDLELDKEIGKPRSLPLDQKDKE